MNQKYLILIDDRPQKTKLEQIKNALKKDGIELIYEEYNPTKFRKNENGEPLFDKNLFIQELEQLPYFKRLDSIVCDYNLIKGVIDGFEIIKIIKNANTNYKKQIILYSTNIDAVIDKIIRRDDNFNIKKSNLKQLMECNIDFIKKNDYVNEVIKHIKKEKPFSFEDELIKWFDSRKDDKFNSLLPIKYQGKKFEEIAECLRKTENYDSIEFKKDLVEQIIAYLSKINGLEA